ncbi:hypothetical protein FM117_00310 [Micrococcus luteus Mu201]|nr:hypothetical protein FM117_00310 [Micrococcus luteus Mu201]
MAGMPRTSTLPAPAPTDHRGGRGVVLVLGVAVTAVSALALVALLAAYFLAWPASPALFALALFGLPVGFGLMLLHVVLGAVRRSRP